MGIREEIEKLKAPVEAKIPKLGTVVFRRLKAGEALTFSTLDNREYDCAILAATAQDENGSPLFASKEEVADLPWPVFRAIRRAYVSLNPVGLDEAAKKSNVRGSSP